MARANRAVMPLLSTKVCMFSITTAEGGFVTTVHVFALPSPSPAGREASAIAEAKLCFGEETPQILQCVQMRMQFCHRYDVSLASLSTLPLFVQTYFFAPTRNVPLSIVPPRYVVAPSTKVHSEVIIPHYPPPHAPGATSD